VTTAGSTIKTVRSYELLDPDLVSDENEARLTSIADPITDTPAFDLLLVSEMTNAGGTIDVNTTNGIGSFETRYAQIPCTGFRAYGNQVVIGGHISGAVVPLPSGVYLFGSGLLGLIGIAKRKQAF